MGETRNKKQIFSILFLCSVPSGNETAWGFYYPAMSFGYQATQAAAPLMASSDLGDDIDDDGNYNPNKNQRRIESGAEYVADEFASGHCEKHQCDAQGR